MTIARRPGLTLPYPQNIGTVRTGARFRRQRQNLVPVFPERSGHVFQRLTDVQSNLSNGANRHALNQEFRAYKGHGTDLIGDVKNMICVR